MAGPDLSLLSLSSVELRRRIGSKEVSPVEVLEASIARIEEVNPAVNAVTATCFKRARSEAKAAEAAARAGDELGILHGLPTGIKDLEETGGLLTTYGSPLFKDFIPERDNVMVDRVRKAGAIVVAKTNVPEFGAGANSRNPVWGATGNPFNPELNAGGSSGGSAVALATDMLPVCTGSDTGGSLRIPGAVNGVVGFRPSPGFVPHERRSLGWSMISVLGPMGRSVGDTCQLFAVQAGAHPVDPLTWYDGKGNLAEPRPVDLGRLRVAWTEDFGQCPVEGGIRSTLRARMKAMAHLFKDCTEVKLDLGEADRCFDVVRAVSFVQRYQKDYEENPGSLGPNIRANYELGAKMTLADVAWAQAEQTRI
ncbi:MAG TPA: amidase family protein [Hyphomicrobiaceae bacterium]|nr:amidase family protein [Hyphomicrobiaceae bacterium]